MDISGLNALTNALNGIDIGESVLFGRIEAYSCKMSGSDRKLHTSLELQLQEQLISPSHERLSVSPFGPMSDRLSRQTLIYLITTLNCAFPHYDFSDAAPEQFVKELSSDVVQHFVNSRLSRVPFYSEDMQTRMWSAIDTEIQLLDCDVYSFNPEIDSDPFNEDGSNVWSFNYFFYNRKLKRVLLITCRAESKAPEESALFETVGTGNAANDYDDWVYDEMEVGN